MLKLIIYKEIADNFRNFRFAVATLLVVIVSLVCVSVLTSNYNDEVKEYQQRIAEEDAAIKEFAHVNRLGAIIHSHIPPSKFHPLVLGTNNSQEIANYNNNPLTTLFPPFDFVVVVSIMLSLLAILFSYNALSGEAENGTLRLMLSNPMRRPLLLTGKWIGGIISLFVPFLLSVLFIATYIMLSPAVQWDLYHWLCLGLLCIGAMLFISVFYLIGLTVSCLTKSSTTSMLIALFIWVVFILVIPNLSPYLSAQFYKVPSVNKIEKETNILTGIERDKLIKEMEDELNRKYSMQYGDLFNKITQTKRVDLQVFFEQNPQAKDIYIQWAKDKDEVVKKANETQREKANKLMEDLTAKSEKQTALAKNMAAISPYSCFVYIATDITGTGLHGMEYNNRQMSAYWNVLYEYINKKFTTMVEKDPTFGYNSYIDLSDRPKFVFTEEPISEKIAVVLPYCLVLLLFNGLFILLAYIRFARYDVR